MPSWDSCRNCQTNAEQLWQMKMRIQNDLQTLGYHGFLSLSILSGLRSDLVYREVKMSSSKHGDSVVWRVAAAASDGAKTSALSRSELIIASTWCQQQQQQHHSNTNPHYIHSITANMADKMDVDAVASEKQVEASGPAPEKPAERSTYTTTATSDCDGLLIDHNSHNRQLRPPRPSRRDLRRPLHSPRAAIHLHHPQVQGLSHRHPHSHPHRFPQRQQPSEASP